MVIELVEEIWKDVVGYEGLYQISNFGNVKSFPHNRRYTTQLLKPAHFPNGYTFVYLWKNGHKKMFMIHRLVAVNFIPNYENKPEVNHKNGIKDSNFADNLEWATCAENSKHAFDTGLNKMIAIAEGSRKWHKTEDGKKHVRDIQEKSKKPVLLTEILTGEIKEYLTCRDAAKAIGASTQGLCCALKGRAKTVKGFTAKYI